MHARVLFASHTARLIGGGEKALLELLLELRSHGAITVIAATPGEGELAQRLREAGVGVHRVATPRWIERGTSCEAEASRKVSYLRRSRAVGSTVRWLPPWIGLVRELDPHIVVTSTATIMVPALAAAVTRTPHVWWLQEFVSPVHGLAFTFGDRFSHQLIARLSSQVIVNSWAVGRHFSPPVPPERVSVVFPSVGSRGLPSNRVVAGELRLLMLGTVAPGKGCDVAIRSLAHLGDAPFTVKLRIVGEGEPRYLRALRGLAQTLHVEEQVEFVPFTRKPDVEIETANALLMCSEDEAFGRVTAEALVNGRPVIGANSGGTPELIADGLDGLLFPPGDAESLSMQIRTLGTDPSRLRHMAIEARSRNEHRFSRAAEVNEFTTVLQRTLR